MKVAVLDASFLLRASHDAAPLESAAAARDVLPDLHERFAVAAPALIAWEIGHALRAVPLAKRADAHAMLLEDVELVLPDADGFARTTALAHAHGLTFYDAAYLELAARESGSLLLTQDLRLLAGARSLLGGDRAFDALGAKASRDSGKW